MTDHVGAADAPAAPSRPRRRLAVITIAIVVALGAPAAVWFTVAQGSGEAEASDARVFDGATDEITRGVLEGSTTVSGTLRYSAAPPVHAGADGTVTEIAAPGTVLSRGDRLAAVNDVPGFLLFGELPAWREFASGMQPGPDVRQLEENLRELGFFDDEPDEAFRWATTEAIMRWQDATGQDDTGRLPLGSVVFAAGDLRVGTVHADVGARVGAGAALFDATTTRKIVEAEVRLADQELAVAGTAVLVHLPGARTAGGSIADIGTPREVDGTGGQRQTVIPVVIALDDAADAAGFQQASVTVDIPSERRDDVLSVPVGALTALSAQQFAVEVVHDDGTTTRAPVTTGLFAGGRVEITGDVEAGQRVVVPQR